MIVKQPAKQYSNLLTCHAPMSGYQNVLRLAPGWIYEALHIEVVGDNGRPGRRAKIGRVKLVMDGRLQFEASRSACDMIAKTFMGIRRVVPGWIHVDVAHFTVRKNDVAEFVIESDEAGLYRVWVTRRPLDPQKFNGYTDQERRKLNALLAIEGQPFYVGGRHVGNE